MMPAYFGNMAPVMVKKHFKFLAIPIDGGRKLGGKPLFGRNKTWRGLIFGVLLGILTAFIQFKLNITSIHIIDYSNWLVFGALMGLGAILGDLIESFVKRRLNRKPGQKFVPWDQTDFVFGSVLLTYMYIPLIMRFNVILTILIMSPLLHIAVNHLAFYTKIRNEKW
jgi:CDP-2,3-bis-(O-geranylgeranyl)-sn-glycerol synthase